MSKQKRATRGTRLSKRYSKLSYAASELRILLGSVIEALEHYDSDDGHNALVMAGVTAEYKRIEDAYEDVLFTAEGRARRKESRP